jgi:Zn-dependent protease
MQKQSIHLGKIFNIPIGLDYSWFLIFTLLTWTLATSYFPSELKDGSPAFYWVAGIVTALLFFLSVLLHELGHSVVALRYKIPVRSITLFIFGGVAQIASEPPYALAEFWIAIAGPVVSFMLAGIFGLLQVTLTSVPPVLAVAKYLAYINGTLGLFNLIPGFPLDGGRVFRAVVWAIDHNFRKATQIAATVGRGIALLFILVGVWQIFTNNLVNGLWIAFIGWFLESAANSQLRQQVFHDLLAGHTVSQAMSRNYTLIPPEITVQQLAESHILGEGRRFFIVEKAGKVEGILTLRDLKDIPHEAWTTTSAAQKMVPLGQIHRFYPEEELSDALKMMDQDGVNQVPIMEEDHILGILSREGIIRFLQTLHEFNRFHQDAAKA